MKALPVSGPSTPIGTIGISAPIQFQIVNKRLLSDICIEL
jgi:hypothetical protein